MKNDSYSILDSGDFEKLEKVGPYRIIRPSPVSAYKKSKPSLWKDPDAKYEKDEKGGGKWKWFTQHKEEFSISLKQYTVKIRFTPFGHLGIFPEQMENWKWLEKVCSGMKPNEDVLNLFAYSGLSTIACAMGGVPVCHLDASKGMVQWARENAALSGLSDRPIRWIVDDVLKFLRREIRRKKKYAGFILDPPSFGRGSKGEVWKIEKDLPELLDLLMELCSGDPHFLLLSGHSTGFGPTALMRILESTISGQGKFECGEMTIPESSGLMYPAGAYARFLTRT